MANTANTLSNGTGSQNPDRQKMQQKQANSPKLPNTRTNYRPLWQTCHAGVHYTHHLCLPLSLFSLYILILFVSATHLNSL